MFRARAENGAPEHPSELDLVLDLDGELPPERREEIGRHLAGCWSCRTQQLELQQGIADFTRFYQGQQGVIPPNDGRRRILQAHLAEAGRAARPVRWQLWGWQTRAWVSAAVAAAAVAVTMLFTLHTGGSGKRAEARNLLRPNHRLSPGYAAAIPREAVCRLQGVEDAHLNPELAQKVFARYRIVRPAVGTYEVDYVVPPALGGLPTEENLWPQPYQEGAWNSHTKDALEEHLEQLVCSGQMPLEQAQAALSADWIGAYEAYFRSPKPLVSHLAFAKDRPWPFSTRVAQ
jgi:hypothetical protein